jgi:hypothetical protein
MSRTADAAAECETTVYREYVKGVRIVERRRDGETRYRFEAPDHPGMTFEDPEKATLYADVFFDTNGFREAGTGEIGLPPAIVLAGMDVITAYMVAQPGTSRDWVASFFGSTPEEVEKYVSWVRNRAEEVRRQAREQGVE